MMKTTVLVVLIAACVALTGCESLVRKFVRKPKERPRAEALLEPQEYGHDPAVNAEMYEQYFLYWKSWQDEFTGALSGTNRKRQLETVGEALRNLTEMRGLLNDEAKARLDVYIRRMEQLKIAVAADPYSAQSSRFCEEAGRIARQVRSDFSPKRAKDSLL